MTRSGTFVYMRYASAVGLLPWECEMGSSRTAFSIVTSRRCVGRASGVCTNYQSGVALPLTSTSAPPLTPYYIQVNHPLEGIYAKFQVIRGFSQKIPADLLSYDKIHS